MTKLTNTKSNSQINIYLLVNSDTFKLYGIPQLEKWEKILNKQQNNNNQKLNNKKTRKNKIHKTRKNKINKKRSSKKFLGLF